MKFDLLLAAVFTTLNLVSNTPAREAPALLEEGAPPGQAPAPEPAPKGLAPSDWSGIHAAHDAWRHRVEPVEGGWNAGNPGQQWTTHFDGRGFLTTPQAASWRWGLELAGYGFGTEQNAITGRPAVRTEGGRLTYQWDAQLEEWFINDRRGLEHGFILHQRPSGGAPGQPLDFRLTVRGGLHPALSRDAQTLHFREAPHGASVLNYSGLKVWDATGAILPSRFALDSSGAVLLRVEESAARYPLTIDPIAQQAYLKAHQVSNGDEFGGAVAISGDTVVVGASQEDSNTTGVNSTPNDTSGVSFNAGAAYVFVRNGGSWSQQAYLKASQVTGGDGFGWSVAVSGDTVVVGAVFEDSSTAGVDSSPNEGAASAGAAYVFVRNGTSWSQQAYLKASQVNGGDEFGWSVAVSGDTVIVGARREDSGTTGVNSTPNESRSNAGAAYVFVRSGVSWSQQAYLKAHQVTNGDEFGWSVGVSGDTAVVGAVSEDSSSSGVNSPPNESAGISGAAYVFVRSGTDWSQQAYLKAHQVNTEDLFGASVAVSGDTVVVGAYQEDSGTTGVNSTPNESAAEAGAAYVFVRDGTNWSQQAYLKAHQVNAGDRFGASVAVSGNTVVVGADNEDSSTTGINSTPNESAGGAGAAYVFVRSGTQWAQQAYLKAHQVSSGDRFALVAVSGDTVVVGAPGEDSSATGVNGTPNESANFPGAAYIFNGLGPLITPLEEWRQLYFGSAANSGNAADDFDFDNDGLVNLVEWAIGTRPNQPSTFQPALIQNNADLEFTYPRSLAAFTAGTGFAVEWSETLAAGSWSTTGVTQAVISTAGDAQTVRATLPAGTQRRHVRLRVQAP